MSQVDSTTTTMQVSVDDTKAAPADSPKPKPFCRTRQYGCCDTKCGCCCCCILTPILALFFFLLIIFLSAWAQTFPATKFTNTKYDTADGVTLHAYVATPVNPKPGTPAVMVFHAWNGMSEEATYFADQLALEGYYAIAPDLFRGVAAEGMNIIWNILTVLTTSQERMDADSDAALAYLKAIENVDDDRISSGPGFCFGGTQSLIFSSRHTMAATVTCYGTYVKELHDPDSSAWGKLKLGGPVLGIYGELDTSPEPDDGLKFGKALATNKMRHNITIYPEVGHGFITPHAHKDSNDPTHAQAVNAWYEIEKFLLRAFSNTVVKKKRSLSNGEKNSVGVGRVGVGSGLSSTSLLVESEEAIAVMEDEVHPPHVVPLKVSLYHRAACAWKCALDHFTHTGHWYSKLS